MAGGEGLEGVEGTLRDGSRVRLRPILPEDKWRLQEGLRQLSPRSRYQRFHTPVQRLSDAQLRYLTEVDGRDHVAWVALDPARPRDPGMGVARWVRLADEPEVAEAAVTVADAYQGRGLGSLLFDLLARSAIAHGVRVLRSYVLAGNASMLAVLENLGARRVQREGGVVVVDLPLPEDPDALPETAAAQLLRASARGEVEAAAWPPAPAGPTEVRDRAEGPGGGTARQA